MAAREHRQPDDVRLLLCAPHRRSPPASAGCPRRRPACRHRARARRSARRRWNGRRGRACRPGMSGAGRACARRGRRRRGCRRGRSTSLRMARPTPVGARYSPKASRSVQPHSPVVTPALAQAIEAGMILPPLVAARFNSFSAVGNRRVVARRAPGLEPLDLLAFGVVRHGHDRVRRRRPAARARSRDIC